MTRPAVVVGLWLAFAFVSWNVMFDRLVSTAATEFAQDQIVRQHSGEALTNIHEGFSPRVRDAALRASLWTTPIVAVGTVALYFSFRRGR
jgi:hypothetical protein